MCASTASCSRIAGRLTRALRWCGRQGIRGSIASRGKFYLNEKWTFGWDGAIATDKFYFTDYKVKPSSLQNYYYTESISKLYLHGRGERSWFDLSAYHFLGLSTTDWQPQIGTAVPPSILIAGSRRMVWVANSS